MFNKFSGGNGPKGTMRLLLLDTFVWLHSPTSTLSIKLQCTIVTKTTIKHLKPKKTKTKNCPHHSEYDALDISLIININNHTLCSAKHMAITECPKISQDIYHERVCIKDNWRNSLEEECYCILHVKYDIQSLVQRLHQTCSSPPSQTVQWTW